MSSPGTSLTPVPGLCLLFECSFTAWLGPIRPLMILKVDIHQWC